MTRERQADLPRLGRSIDRIASAVIIAAVRCYQVTISPWLGRHCRFDPTCSRYVIEAVRRYGCIKGLAKGAARIARCHPFHPGGHDPP